MTHAEPSAPPSIGTTLLRGIRLRCPRCGGDALFEGMLRLRKGCGACGLAYAPYAQDTWAMIYFSTAGLTGAVLVLLIVLRPANLLLGRVAIGLIAAVAIVASLPFRKGAAIAVNWLIASRTDPEGGR
jgi:uncharacterized protein (DUF983 family)